MIFDPRPRLLEALQPVRGQSTSFTVSFPDPEIWAAVRAGLRDLLEWWGARVPLISGILTWIAATTLISGAPLAKEIPATCYLYSYFLGNGEDGLHLAWSRDDLKT